MNRVYWIPTTAALGLGLTGCTGLESVEGDWNATVLDGFEWPVEYTILFYVPIAYSLTGTLSIDNAGTARLQLEEYYSVDYTVLGYEEPYTYTYTYTYTGAISKASKRKYSIQLENEGGSELALDCVLRDRDMLDCDERFEEDVGNVFVFERD